MKGGLRKDLVWKKLLDGLNDAEVSKGVLVAWTSVTILMRVNFLLLQMPLSLSLARVEGKSEERSW